MAYSLLSVTLLAALLQSAPDAQFPCFKHHGRFSTQNGITQRLWLIGTKRSLAVDGDLPKPLADLEDPWMSMTGGDHSYIYGDFTICPLEPDVPGHARHVILRDAEKLVVQPLDGVRPAFKVMSTWPKK